MIIQEIFVILERVDYEVVVVVGAAATREEAERVRQQQEYPNSCEIQVTHLY